jgi:hypothetical protein
MVSGDLSNIVEGPVLILSLDRRIKGVRAEGSNTAIADVGQPIVEWVAASKGIQSRPAKDASSQVAFS